MWGEYLEIVVVSDNYVCKGILMWYKCNVWFYVVFSWKDFVLVDGGFKVFNDVFILNF